MIDPVVSFIIPTCGDVDKLRVILSSLIVQTNINWEAIVVMDGKENKESVDSLVKEIFSKRDFRIRVYELDFRHNDWGHTPREWGKQRAIGKYVVMTGDDNYYVPSFVDEVYKVAIKRPSFPGMIYWDMLHNQYDYQHFVCTPAFNQIDIGAFATRTDLAKHITLGREYAADGIFVEEYNKEYPLLETVKINKVLYVHN